jgi:hypothetical protein
MPSFSLGALNAETDWVPIGNQTFTFDVSGTFVGTVRFFYRAAPSGAGSAVARDNVSGSPIEFQGASGVVLGRGAAMEPDAQVQARMVAYTSGAAAVRIGR